MLDHVFTDAISALRDAFAKAYLERQAFEEHFQSDILVGDLVWETSYGLPGEGSPPRVLSHIIFNWPSWSQAMYRRWYVEEVFDLPPAIEIEVVFRVQRLVGQPDASVTDAVAGLTSPPIGSGVLERLGATVEILHPTGEAAEFAIEVAYEGSYELAEETLADGSSALLDDHFGALGGWIATTLVRLGDLGLSHLPPEDT